MTSFYKIPKDYKNNLIDSAIGGKYTNLNLNQKIETSTTLCKKSFNGIKAGKVPIKNYGNDIKSQERNGSISWKRSSKALFPCRSRKSVIQQDPPMKEKEACSKSTLSLHIATYENNYQSSDGELNVIPKKHDATKKQKKAKQNIIDIQNPFEFPRQQEGDEPKVPEVAQFKASQRLLNPNGSSNMNLETSEISVLGFGPVKFLIIAELGRGAFGVVNLGLRGGKLYAIKTVSKELAAPFSMYSEEYLSLRNCHNFHIIELRGHFEFEDQLFLFLDYAENGSLKQKIGKHEHGMKENMVFYNLFQLFFGISYLQSHHIIHRDLKSDNVFISQEVVLKLGDFGLATRMSNVESMYLSDVGTPDYKAPEVKHGFYGYKSDVFSLGMICAESITGKHPGGDIMKRGYVIPAAFADLLKGLLAEDPAKRFSLNDLKEYLKVKFDRNGFIGLMKSVFAEHGVPIPNSEDICLLELKHFDDVIIHGAHVSVTQRTEVSADKTPPEENEAADDSGPKEAAPCDDTPVEPTQHSSTPTDMNRKTAESSMFPMKGKWTENKKETKNFILENGWTFYLHDQKNYRILRCIYGYGNLAIGINCPAKIKLSDLTDLGDDIAEVSQLHAEHNDKCKFMLKK